MGNRRRRETGGTGPRDLDRVGERKREDAKSLFVRLFISCYYPKPEWPRYCCLALSDLNMFS